MNDIDKFIWPGEEKKIINYNTNEWIDIVKTLLKSLENFLEWAIISEDSFEKNVGEGFSIDFKSNNKFFNSINLSCEGILGADFRDESNCLSVSAIIFLYSNGKKLITNNTDCFLLFEYVQDKDGVGSWEGRGWKQDEHGEYEYFDK